jgi:Rrf2 family protein
VPFSKALVHGIYILCYLSRQDPQSVVSSSAIARAVSVPPQHARKLTMRLCFAGLVRSTLGRSGGYALARSLECISVLDVLDAVSPAGDDQTLEPRMCALGSGDECCVQPGLAELRMQMRGVLGGKALSSVVGPECPQGPVAAGDIRQTDANKSVSEAATVI